MGYQPNIPQPGTLLSVSQNDLLNNFEAIDDGFYPPSGGELGFNREHVSMKQATIGGQHIQVSFPSPPATIPTATGTESVVYPNVDGSGNQQLFFANALGLTQITGESHSFSNPGFQKFANGLIIKWGNGGGASSVTFPTGGSNPSFTNCWCVVASVQGGSIAAAVAVTAITVLGFTYKSTNSTNTVYYIAIGN